MEVAAVDARIEQVTVYARGARVRRVVTIPAPLPARVRIVGLPLAVIDDTVRVEVGGPAIATAVRAGVDAPAGDAAPEESAELRAAHRRLAIAETEVERITAALELLAAAPVIEEDPGDEAPPAWSAVVGARRTVVAVRVERELVLRERSRRRVARPWRRSARSRRSPIASDARAPRRSRSCTSCASTSRSSSSATAASEIAIRLEYQVAAARWAPSYVARHRWRRRSRFELRAVVAQDAGEDWTGVALRLSTAEPERFAPLPELAAAEDRPPATGAGEAAGSARRPSVPTRCTRTTTARCTRASARPRRCSRARARSRTRPTRAGRHRRGPPMAVPCPISSPSKCGTRTRRARRRRSTRRPRGIACRRRRIPPPLAAARPAPAPPAPQMMKQRAMIAQRGCDERGRRGASSQPPAPPSGADAAPRLRQPRDGAAVDRPRAARSSPAPRDAACRRDRARGRDGGRAHRAARACRRAASPTGPTPTTTRSRPTARSTSRADGAWHSIAVTARAGTAKLRHVAVPREQADVFRVAEIVNPFDGPLLPGPIDVYDRGQFLVTSDGRLHAARRDRRDRARRRSGRQDRAQHRVPRGGRRHAARRSSAGPRGHDRGREPSRDARSISRCASACRSRAKVTTTSRCRSVGSSRRGSDGRPIPTRRATSACAAAIAGASRSPAGGEASRCARPTRSRSRPSSSSSAATGGSRDRADRRGDRARGSRGDHAAGHAAARGGPAAARRSSASRRCSPTRR